MLFWGGIDYYSPRSYRHAWNLGHVLLFFIITYLLLRSCRIGKLDLNTQLVLILIIVSFLAVLTELIQSRINRIPSLNDVLKDLTGSLFAIAFFPNAQIKKYKKHLRVIQLVAVIFVILACRPLTQSLADEYIAQKQFPVLSGFETPFEIKRWSCETGCEIDHEVVISGKSSLKVPLLTTEYSGVSLRYFPGDWRHFSSLHFNVFNASLEPLVIYSRIQDLQHLKNYQYSDRFNTKFTLKHGWNSIEISLSDVINSPKGRKIDLANIHGFGIFVISLPKPELIYIDNVRLK